MKRTILLVLIISLFALPLIAQPAVKKGIYLSEDSQTLFAAQGEGGLYQEACTMGFVDSLPLLKGRQGASLGTIAVRRPVVDESVNRGGWDLVYLPALFTYIAEGENLWLSVKLIEDVSFPVVYDKSTMLKLKRIPHSENIIVDPFIRHCS